MIWFFFLICQFCFLSSSKSLPRILTYFQVVEKSPDTSRCLGECSCKCCSSQSPAYLPTYRVDHLGCRSCVARVSSEIKTADVHLLSIFLKVVFMNFNWNDVGCPKLLLQIFTWSPWQFAFSGVWLFVFLFVGLKEISDDVLLAIWTKLIHLVSMFVKVKDRVKTINVFYNDL